MEYIVQDKQSWLDISISVYGTAQYAYQIAYNNNAALTDLPVSGTVIEALVADYEANNDVLNALKLRNWLPATYPIAAPPTEQGGIEFWGIEYDFEVQDSFPDRYPQYPQTHEFTKSLYE